uniref:RRM domain-containing protein n=1 Tax=Ananas comosus var. bracteatus TaxID=296719 RepID=A0A6V7P7V3_ANACO|nr:unnamed protein product [Ananas comosus var. bracteatus]
MATKKRKVDQEDDLLSAPNHHDSSDHKTPRQTLYFPIPDDAPAAAGTATATATTTPALRRRTRTWGSSWSRSRGNSSSPSSAPPRRATPTTSEGLRAAFARYGEIEDCRVIVDKPSGRSKGYGFVQFRHRSSASRALREPQKLIDNRMTACQLASTGPTPHGHQQHNPSPNPLPNPSHSPNPNPNPSTTYSDNLPRKIYVANVHADIDGTRLYNFFAKFGEIEEGPLGFDRQTGKAKGFALFVYKTLEGAQKALEEPIKNFEGHLLQCQRATDGDATECGNARHAGGGRAESGCFWLQSSGACVAEPAFAAAALGAGAQPTMAPSAVTQTSPIQGLGVGSIGYQTAGFQGGPPGFQGPSVLQGPPGFQGPPGYQGTTPVTQQGGAAGTAGVAPYQAGPAGQAQMPRPPIGHMGGYGQQH